MKDRYRPRTRQNLSFLSETDIPTDTRSKPKPVSEPLPLCDKSRPTEPSENRQFISALYRAHGQVHESQNDGRPDTGSPDSPQNSPFLNDLYSAYGIPLEGSAVEKKRDLFKPSSVFDRETERPDKTNR